MALPQLKAGLPFNAFQRPERDLPLRMWDRNAALLRWVLELDVAALLSHLNPAVPLKARDNFSAIHSVYLYTFRLGLSMKGVTSPDAHRSPRAPHVARLTPRRCAASASDTFHVRSRISARCGNRSVLDPPARRA